MKTLSIPIEKFKNGIPTELAPIEFPAWVYHDGMSHWFMAGNNADLFLNRSHWLPYLPDSKRPDCRPDVFVRNESVEAISNWLETGKWKK